MIIIDNKDRRAIYEQVVDKLSNLMLLGALKTEDRLPSVRTLATELSINPNTIQKAYLELERQGFIYSVKGVGSFVSDLQSIREAKKASLRQDLKILVARARLVMSEEELLQEVQELYSRDMKEREGHRI